MTPAAIMAIRRILRAPLRCHFCAGSRTVFQSTPGTIGNITKVTNIKDPCPSCGELWQAIQDLQGAVGPICPSCHGAGQWDIMEGTYPRTVPCTACQGLGHRRDP